jgi:hypothetical protein
VQGDPLWDRRSGEGRQLTNLLVEFAQRCSTEATPTFQEIAFTVTNVTLAQLETPNANGNLFVADIISSDGLIGEVSVPVPVPLLLRR